MARIANVMKSSGVKRGDVVTIYMSMVPELAMVMLACARIGAIHSVVFAGFSADSLKDRIMDCSSNWVFACDEGKRGGRTINLKETTDIVSYAALIHKQHHSMFPLSPHDVSHNSILAVLATLAIFTINTTIHTHIYYSTSYQRMH